VGRAEKQRNAHVWVKQFWLGV